MAELNLLPIGVIGTSLVGGSDLLFHFHFSFRKLCRVPPITVVSSAIKGSILLYLGFFSYSIPTFLLLITLFAHSWLSLNLISSGVEFEGLCYLSAGVPAHKSPAGYNVSNPQMLASPLTLTGSLVHHLMKDKMTCAHIRPSCNNNYYIPIL